jgi:hypothetical protein
MEASITRAATIGEMMELGLLASCDMKSSTGDLPQSTECARQSVGGASHSDGEDFGRPGVEDGVESRPCTFLVSQNSLFTVFPPLKVMPLELPKVLLAVSSAMVRQSHSLALLE